MYVCELEVSRYVKSLNLKHNDVFTIATCLTYNFIAWMVWSGEERRKLIPRQ